MFGRVPVRHPGLRAAARLDCVWHLPHPSGAGPSRVLLAPTVGGALPLTGGCDVSRVTAPGSQALDIEGGFGAEAAV